MTRLDTSVSFGHFIGKHRRRAGDAQLSTGLLDLDGSSIKKKDHTFVWSFFFYGAGDEARTRYLHLGKVALYRMSYTRNGHGLL